MAANLAHDHPYLAEGGSLAAQTDYHAHPPVDASRRILHVLPKLLVVPDEMVVLANSTRPQVALRVDVRSRLEEPANRSDIVVRRALPNRRYFVGGTRSMKYGWFVPLADTTTAVDLTFHWHIAEGARQHNHVIRHDLHLELLPGPFRTYTMDPMSWFRSGLLGTDTPLERSMFARVYGKNFSAKRRIENVPVALPDPETNGADQKAWKPCVAFREFAQLPSVALSDLIGIRSFG